MAAEKLKNGAAAEKLWQEVVPERATGEKALMIDVAGFEGPLDLLLHLARAQKVDLSRISVLALAEQYLQFVEDARRVRIELAADYLVMAAWLAFLKSKLLIPRQSKDDGPSGEEMAAALAFRLKRLEAMREAAERLLKRDRLGRDILPRGAPEHIPHSRGARYEASLYDLLRAYAALRQRQAITQVTIEKRQVWSLVEARELLTSLIGELGEWTALDRSLLHYISNPALRTMAIASAFAASLELVREGSLEMRQDGVFAPIYIRKGPKGGEAMGEGGAVMMSDEGQQAAFPFQAERLAAAFSDRVLQEAERIAEALVFASAQPVSEAFIAERLPRGMDVAAVMERLAVFYRERGVNLLRVGGDWVFRTASDLSFVIRADDSEPKKLSRAALEVLAIVAYHQPVTRAEIEEIRGVQTSRGTLDVLMEAGWVRFRGRRRTPGRPVTIGTTVEFLDHFGLEELRDLPGLEELKGAGLLSGRIPANFGVPVPIMSDELQEDEDPITQLDLDELGLLAPSGGDGS